MFSLDSEKKIKHKDKVVFKTEMTSQKVIVSGRAAEVV